MSAKAITKGENYRSMVKILARELRPEPWMEGKEREGHMMTRRLMRIEAKHILSKIKTINERYQGQSEKMFGTMLRIASSDGSSNGLEYSAINLCSMVVLSSTRAQGPKRLGELARKRFGPLDLISLFGYHRHDLSAVVTSIDWGVSRIDSESEKARSHTAAEASLANFFERRRLATYQRR